MTRNEGEVRGTTGGVHDAERERIRGVYDAYARSPRKRRAWDPGNPGNVAMRRELFDALAGMAGALLDGGLVLDVGCGEGAWLRDLAARGVSAERLHGVDLLPARIRAAEAALPRADLRVADARALPHPAGRFELVTMLTLLSSLPDRPARLAALAEARRVLVPGGLLLCYEPRLPNPLNRATRAVRPRDLEEALGPGLSATPLTAFPPLARRLGRLAGRGYPILARPRGLRTHRLLAWRRPAEARSPGPPA